ncbi:MCE family protein [bacterium]|nr:MCE family protein [bacterium]
MGHRARLTGIGLVVAVATYFLGYYSTYLLWEDLRPWQTYRVTFPRTRGLREKDDVLALGLKIGRVGAIKLEGDHHLVVLEVDPSVTLHADCRVEIRTADAFGTAVVDVEPGTSSAAWPTKSTIPGTMKEGFTDIPTDSSSQTALTDFIKEWDEATTALVRIEGGTAGRLLNDPDVAGDFREAFAQTRDSTRNFRELAEKIARGEGPGALVTASPEEDLRSSVARLNDESGLVRESLTAAAHGEGGLAGRILGDASAGERLRAGITDAAEILSNYASGEGRLGGFLAGPPEAGERIEGFFSDMADATQWAHAGEGRLGGLLGPGTGDPMRAFLSKVDDWTIASRNADPGAGVLFSPSSEGKRAILGDNEDPDKRTGIARIEQVLKNVRLALIRVRSEQSPNTFQGALLSVF